MDHTMRALLSQIGGMDYLVSEFVRVTQYAIPSHTFKRLVPENQHGAQTRHQHPVHTQLLGSNAELMAQSAYAAHLAGANHIDINFGCPAKRVNGHGGGSVLLQYPETLYDIVSSIREALPKSVVVSAKIRLGYEDEHLLFDNVDAISSAGAQKLTVHGRTKKDGYRPPARWEKIALINERTKMEVVANGDITDFHSLMQCQEITGCNHFMIGRGSLNNPFVFEEIRAALTGQIAKTKEERLYEVFADYAQQLQEVYDEVATLGRLKQWCGHLRFHFPVVKDNLQALRRANSFIDFMQVFEQARKQQ
ncbi:tRNA-dihydrouridine synthase [Marinomonas epiphytica]